MPWPNARTCRQACHAAGLAPRLTAAQVLLVTVLVWMGSFPTVTRARGLQGADTAAPGLEDPPRNAQGGPSLLNQTGIEGRNSRSLNLYDKIKNEKWLVSKNGFFLVIHQNGSVVTTNEREPRMGILVFGSESISNKSMQSQLFSQLPTDHPYVTTIMGKESNRFLCINRKGKVYSRQNYTSECGFNATVQAHNFETYCQPFKTNPRRRPGKRRSKTNRCRMKCLGISKRGKIRNSKRVCFTDEHAKLSTIIVKSSTTPVNKPFPGLTMPETTSQPGPHRPRTSRPPRPTTRRPRPAKKEPCRGLFCKNDEERGTRVEQGRRRKHRDPRGRRAGRHRRRNSRRRNMDRQRRARGGTPGEEGPLSDVT